MIYFKVLQKLLKCFSEITTSVSFLPTFCALSIFTPLILEVQLINDALFLNATALFRFALSGLETIIFPFTTKYHH